MTKLYQKKKVIKRTSEENLFNLFTALEEVTMKRKRKTLSEEAPEEYGEFVVWFMEKYKSAINRHVHRRLIPNRYSAQDVKAYIQECILKTLQRRKSAGRPIDEPKLYFRKLIDYYCVEYQRMHGFIYSLPKRPRCPDAEADISNYGFFYYHSDNEGGIHPEVLPQLGYLDYSLENSEEKEVDGFAVLGGDPSVHSSAWNKLMLMALPEDQKVLECVFMMDMSIPEASRHLKIAVSTAYQRAQRGIRAISGTLITYVDLDLPKWKILNSIKDLEDDDVDVKKFYDNV